MIRKTPAGRGIRLSIEPGTEWSDLALGESIAVNGVCLTVTHFARSLFTVDVSPESLSRTNIEEIGVGSVVNLERALRPTDRLGGHIVSGHVDTRGIISGRREHGAFTLFSVQLPQAFGKYVIEKGSIAVDGISLTVTSCNDTSFSVSIIPFTAQHTTMGRRREGDMVNIEFDVIGKYVERLLARGRDENAKSEKGGITRAFLTEHGIT